ncbi:MAG: TrkH family potassium uptake protein [Clostridia bacterium]|nr:TrkH family potassium uptake protein [Clostridia bacterium]
MNKKMVLYTLGKIIWVEAALLLLPVVVCLLYSNDSLFSFAVTLVTAVAVAAPLTIFCKPQNKVIYSKEGFVIVSLAWIVMSLIGALPFVISGEIPSFIDAFFETVSGFTTTGASIIENVEAMSEGILFWRSFTHWIGGMGVLVFVMALTAGLPDRSIHIMRAEMPGPIVDKLVPKARETAKILYLIYICMTVAEIIILVICKMPLFEALVHTFGTAGTGGFGVKADSIAGYSPVIQWVITVFMFLFGINFNLYYLILLRRIKSAFKSSELWVYAGVGVVSCIAITFNISEMYGSFSEALRHSAFQVSTVMTTTGYATADFNMWPGFSKTLLLILMFMGACAGSTAGGLKVSRVIILAKGIRRELTRLLHPRSVKTLKLDGKRLDEQTLSTTALYFTVYAACLVAVWFILSMDKYDTETNFSAAIACFNNIGPGLGIVGPAGNYSGYSVISKIVLSAAMLLGRLEIFPMLLCFSPATWSKKK